MITVRKGLDLPITGQPEQAIDAGPPIQSVALVSADYIGMKPTMEVKEGDRVKLGQLLFTDKKTDGVRYTSPGCGKVKAVNRGDKRAFLSVVIELAGDEEETFASFPDTEFATLTHGQVQEVLVASGLWTTLRTRPFSRVPLPGTKPHSLFVTAIDTNPLAPKPGVILAERQADFVQGLQILKHLTEGQVYLCTEAGSSIPGSDLPGIEHKVFGGPHPAGLAGTHIHLLDPVSLKKTVWYINYQDVIAVGYLFKTGRILTDRWIALGGPSVKNPRLLQTRIGACLSDLVENELNDGEHRVISGSVLSGRKSIEPVNYLGRLHNQVSVIPEGHQRELLGWLTPGFDKFSIKNLFASAWGGGGKNFAFTTSTGGSKRAMVPIGMYEQVMPLDVIPTFLLRALIVGDTEQAQELGALELDEEDLSLCTFVCPGKYEYGPILREVLTRIEKEG